MLRGSMVALVTPMQEDGSLDENSLRELIDWHVEQGSDGIVAVGTTGECPTLNEDEHCQIVGKAVEFAAGRIPVIAGTGANSTTEALSLTQRAKEVGVDACLLVSPYYNKPTQEGLYQHHKLIAETIDIPQILYNVPGRTAVDLLPETAARLSEISNIVGIKEATGEMDRVSLIKKLCGEDFAIYSGDDATARELLLLGGHGVISVTANVAPMLMRQMCEAALAGDSAEAERLDTMLEALHRDLFVESNPIPVKWAVAEMGRIPTGIRLPLTWLSKVAREPVRQAMIQAGVL